MRRFSILGFLFGLSLYLAAAATRGTFTPYRDAEPILQTLAEIAPAELRDVPPERRESAWNGWASKRDAEIRLRLAQGDADSIVNFLMFGTSFTSAPRLTSAQLREAVASPSAGSAAEGGSRWERYFLQRVADLVQAMAAPGSNERLLFARKTLEGAGVNFQAADYKSRAGKFLLENLKRVLQEQASYQQTLAAAKSLNDATEEFAERSKLYKERGLSLDTSLPPNYALEVALKEMKSRGLLKQGGTVRVGIIGPGLDFTDKQEGYDFYPTQTVQPFAVMDSLLRLQLADAKRLEVDTLDLSPRVLSHVEQAVALAARGQGYTIQLPRDGSRGWNPALVHYWEQFGDQVGTPTQPKSVPAALQGLTQRAVRVKPEFLRRMKTFDANIVLQRATLADAEKFDLLVATNILVYYDTFEQSLAMANIAAMLKPGGFLLTNNLLLELPVSQLHAGDYVSVPYSEKEGDGDRIVWYSRTIGG